MHSFTTTILAALASLTLAAPATAPGPVVVNPLGISLSSDSSCSTLTSGTPSSLEPGVFYPVDSGFSSMEIYAPPTQGSLTVYDCANQTESSDTQNFSTEYRGCIANFEFVGRGIMYTV
ncbi:hypothetical protein DOTSEDRAFT_20543 [Dothistroma septosporum NZE10]|uniref:Uncharacterized protein n=1 Tax=Dothistroma septosporum (strain NZE10 / CBS 128990) TaxID=675120 RepID=N1Q554_DOTSN|nr:hypothetical protein DOTSEDRAFT_20543 [Dothistroma septosporum NZE10]